MSGIHKKRVKHLQGRLSELGLGAFVTLNLTNLRYLTGFSGTSGAAVVTKKTAFFLTDFRYASQVKEQVKSMKIAITKELYKEAARIVSKSRAKVAGYEEHNLTVADFKKLKKGSRLKWRPVKIVEELRLIKDSTEVKSIEKNFKQLERVYWAIGQVIKPGHREREAAGQMEYLLRQFGSEGPAFEFIVASGKRSALPHGTASEKLMKTGEAVIIDWGGKLDGYHSDNSRTVFLGKPKKKLEEIFNIVLEANRRAIDKVAPGVPLKDIDAAARDFIAKKGYAKEFGHGTGHGVGLEIHEAPNVNPRSKDIAKEGMVFTIEPGIYIPGVGGVRIEDVIVVTKRGCRVLSDKIPKEMRIL